MSNLEIWLLSLVVILWLLGGFMTTAAVNIILKKSGWALTLGCYIIWPFAVMYAMVTAGNKR